jgi:mannose-6-phosphate isomerase-like protein (cupin superfamily)
MRSVNLIIIIVALFSFGCAPPPASEVQAPAVESDHVQGTVSGVRRLVTGHDSSGKAIFASDERVEPVTLALLPGAEFYRIWGADVPPRFPDDGSMPVHDTYFPPVGGFRFALFTVAPDSLARMDDLDMNAAFVEIEEKLPGSAQYLEPDHPGMHTTASIDFEYVVSGRCVLELDDGESRELGPGDTVIQNGTRHAWRNPFDEPCLMVVVLIGTPNDLVPAAEN